MGDQESGEQQSGLFPDLPIRAKRCDPLAVSADCKQVCRCDDGSDYAIKEAAVIASMPHNEWLCAKLAERVSIAAAPFRIVDVLGIQCFGSRWLAGEESDWWNKAFAGQFPFTDIAPGITRIFTLDLFVHNHDRHLNNYFVVKQKVGHAVLAMDFGRAWLFSGFPPPALPMEKTSNTIGDYRKLVTLFGDFLDHSEVDDVCDKILGVTVDEISGFIASHPRDWLEQSMKDAICDWWSSDDKSLRVEGIREGIKNGSLL